MDEEILIKQLTGGKGIGCLTTMLGAKDFMKDDENNCLTFKFKGCKKVNAVRIILNSMDLYDLEFYKIKLPDFNHIETLNNVGGDEIKKVFTDYTGLDTSL